MIQSLRFEYHGISYIFDITKPLDISLEIKNGEDNVNCYDADPVDFETIRQGDFIGSVAEGGPCNYQKITITPHGNGTHTECYGHVSADPKATLNQSLKKYIFFAQLISLPYQSTDNQKLITLNSLKSRLKSNIIPEALIIRTIPNDPGKKNKKYSGTHPPYLEPAIGIYLADLGIEHLLVDLPSVDPEVDGGQMLMHKKFWRYPEHIRSQATISELIYINDHIQDGYYVLNLQITSLETDASPSKPVLYALKPES